MTMLVVGALCVLGGLALGLLIGLVVGRKDVETARAGARAETMATQARLEAASQRAVDVQGIVDQREKTLANCQDEIARLREERGKLVESVSAEKAISAQQRELLEAVQLKFRDAFQALAGDALKTNSKSFLDLATESLGKYQEKARTELDGKHKAVEDVVRPIQDTMGKVEIRLREIELERQNAYAQITEQVRAMAAGQQQLQSETARLVNALRAPTVRGRWGEIQLKRVIELAGMLDHCDFLEQAQTLTDDGRLRPDVIVRLPGGKNIVVDAKVPLSAYLEALETTGEPEREARLRHHARQVRDHMGKLSSKGYWEQFQPTPELVVMFLPGEPYFSAALQHDPSLIEYGADRRVIPASPLTLISLLRAVHYGWRQERLAENAQAISDLGRELYERIERWLEHFARVGKGLSTAVAGYNLAVGSLNSRLLVSARKFKELGSATTRELAEVELIDQTVRSAASEDAEPLPELFEEPEPELE